MDAFGYVYVGTTMNEDDFRAFVDDLDEADTRDCDSVVDYLDALYDADGPLTARRSADFRENMPIIVGVDIAGSDEFPGVVGLQEFRDDIQQAEQYIRNRYSFEPQIVINAKADT